MAFTPKLNNKRWDTSLEAPLFKKWKDEDIYALDTTTDKKIWSIDTPPPYASGKWHLGGAIHYSQIDTIARIQRMKGYHVLFPMGIDRNGLPIEVQAEKEFKVRMWDTPRGKFLEMCKSLLDKYDEQILSLCKQLGFSCNSLSPEDVYRTDSASYRAVTQATFIELYKKGLITIDNRPNNYCVDCGTTIADAEIEYKDIPTAFNYMKFTIKETGDIIEIATTRPELLCACAAVLVHPEDERYKHLFGKTAITPVFNIEVPIIPHTDADPEQGSGIVMICSYGDYTDVRLFRDLRLIPIIAIDPEGKMTEAAGEFEGLSIKECRKAVVEAMKKNDQLIKVEEFVHHTPVCWRSKTPIEFIPMPEFYLNQLDYLYDIEEIADKIVFHPKKHKQLLLDWLSAVTVNWPISRRRYYGTEVPLWYCKSCKEVLVPEPGQYYQPWKDEPPIQSCEKCGGVEFEGEGRTFDTWMDSSISALQVLHYKRDDAFFEKAFPCSVRPQGKDIIRTWLYYTLLRSYQLTGKPVFEHVWISGHVVDEHGKKMSKSLGNAVWPEKLATQYSADALRFWGCLEASNGSDIRFSDERLKGASKFIQKLYNISRFISMFPSEVEKKDCTFTGTDQWIFAQLNKTIKESDRGYTEFDFIIPASKIRSFTWNTFADIYLEAVKKRAYNSDETFTPEEQNAAHYTLHTVLKTVLKLLAPITPFITDYVWNEVYSPESIHLESYPEENPLGNPELAEITDTLNSVNSFVWKTKKNNGFSLREGVEELYLPESLKSLETDLKAMHGADKVLYGAPTSDAGYEKEEIDEKVSVFLKLKEKEQKE